MKNIKCPLCGEEYEFNKITISKKYEYRQARCLVCKYSLDLSNTMTGAKKIAEEFISKFPPFMRVHEGNIVEILRLYGPRPEKINSIEIYINSTSIDNITKWPWEFKQEEGAEQ